MSSGEFNINGYKCSCSNERVFIYNDEVELVISDSVLVENFDKIDHVEFLGLYNTFIYLYYVKTSWKSMSIANLFSPKSFYYASDSMQRFTCFWALNKYYTNSTLLIQKIPTY